MSDKCRNSTRRYWWTLWLTDNTNLIQQTYYDTPENQPNAVTITFGIMTIAPGLYKVQFLFNLTDIEGGSVIDYAYANFILPPVIAGIAGGSTRSIAYDAVIQLNSKDASHDPLLSMQHIPFIYTWICRKTSSTEQAISDIIARFRLEDVSVDVNGIGTDCSNPSWPVTGVIPFDASLVTVNNWYLFTVNLSKTGDSRTGEAIQGIFVLSTTPPTVFIA